MLYSDSGEDVVVPGVEAAAAVVWHGVQWCEAETSVLHPPCLSVCMSVGNGACPYMSLCSRLHVQSTILLPNTL